MLCLALSCACEKKDARAVNSKGAAASEAAFNAAQFASDRPAIDHMDGTANGTVFMGVVPPTGGNGGRTLSDGNEGMGEGGVDRSEAGGSLLDLAGHLSAKVSGNRCPAIPLGTLGKLTEPNAAR